MNRFQRRATTALARKESAGANHANRSFTDLVSQANRDALKPFIIECMGELEQIIRQDIARLNIEALAPVQTRLTALEKLAMEKLGETPESLAKRYVDAEDQATGYAPTDAGAEPGDLVRATWALKVEGQPNWSKETKIVIYRLAQLRENPESGQQVYQTYEALEKALVGAKAGETREIEVEIPQGEVKTKYTFKVTVDRVSQNLQDRFLAEARARAAAALAAQNAPSQEAPTSEAPVAAQEA